MSARSKKFSTAVPGTTSPWNAKCPRPATSSAPMSVQRPWSSFAVTTAPSMSSRTAVHIAPQNSAVSSAATSKNSSALTISGPTIFKAISPAFHSGAASTGGGGLPADFDRPQHGLRWLNVTTPRGVVFASYVRGMESLQDYLGPEVLKEFEATFDGRKPRLLGYYRHTLPGNWKLYHENLK